MAPVTITEIGPWIALVAQIFLFGIGYGKLNSTVTANAKAAGKAEAAFNGRMKAAEEAFAERLGQIDRVLGEKIGQIDHRLGAYDEAYSASIRERENIGSRLSTVERDMAESKAHRERLLATTDNMRDGLSSLIARSDEQHKNMKEQMQSMARTLTRVEREVANYSTGRVAAYPDPRRFMDDHEK